MIKLKEHFWYTFLLVAAFVILGAISISHMNQVLLSNAQVTGTGIAERFCAAEESYITRYELLLDMGAQGLEYEINKGKSDQELSAWLEDFLQGIQQETNSRGIDVYASVRHHIVAASLSNEDSAFDPTNTSDIIWYQNAIDAKGKIVYTKTYINPHLQQTVITISKCLNNNQDVLAINLYPNLFSSWPSLETAPNGTHYFLCDSAGNLLHFQTHGETELADVQEYASKLFAQIQAETFPISTTFITGIDHRQRGLYYHEASNGWISIVTIPKDYLLSGLASVRIFYLIIVIASLLICVWLLLSSAHSDQQANLYNKIARVLGNSYYALYLVNFKKGTYSMLKAPDYLRGYLKPMGNYSVFLISLHKIIEPKAYEEFCKSFSIANIQELVKQNVQNFGGDFQRLFHDEYHWVHVQLIYDQSLSDQEVVLCFQDVNTAKEKDLKQTQLLKDSLQIAQKNNERRSLFFSSMSHDMRTPLNAIIGLSNLAQHHVESPKRLKNDIRKIKIAGQQLLELVNDILEMSRMEQGKQELNLHAFDLEERLRECLEIFQVQAETQQKHFTIEINIHHTKLVGDWSKLQQIINNIISNAFKFTPQNGSIGIEVQEFCEQNSKYPKFQFVICDTGIGMSQEFLKKIFTPFERECRFTVASITGTGLGMSIAYSLVTQMEGKIEVESEVNKGTTFTVTLPLLIEENCKTISTDTSSNTDQSLMDMSGKHVLLAEDNPINMEISTELLKMCHFDVTQAWNGKEALELFQSQEFGYFDVILLDMQMPVMDGCQAAEAIRRLEREDAKTIPIIAVTANAFAEDIAKTHSAGMNAHITKPIDLHVLEQTLQELL